MDGVEQQQLLEHHSPIVIYDDRELFFPLAVDPYFELCSLVVDGHEVAGPGEIDPEQLRHDLPEGSYLQFVSDADRRAVVGEEAKRLAGKMLGPRLGRVGLFGRILDAIFLLSVFIRPTTPRRTTVAAALKAEQYRLHLRPVVYGRVVEAADWVVLHYAYFYVMNDWRSGYGGLNDHEADWEQAWIYLDPETLAPIWSMASNHDHDGAELRRHWEDPECRVVGDRPVLYAGAGSHAFYFRPGDYVTRIDIQPLRWLLRLQRWVRQVLRIRDQAAERGLGPALGMPFVESASGNGLQIANWDVQPLDDDRPCFGQFQGLWGLDTGDPAEGERGPAGPKFTRAGDVRSSWADPIGHAGLHGSSPPSRAPVEATLDNIQRSLAYIEMEIERTARLLPLVQRMEPIRELAEDADRLTGLYRQRTHLIDLAKRLGRGEPATTDIRAHLQRPATPLAPPQESGWILAAWAAASVPLLLLALASPFISNGLGLTTLVLIVTAVFSLVEQLVRRHFQAVFRMLVLYALLVGVALLLGALQTGVLQTIGYLIGVVLAIAAALLFVANLGELSAVRRRAEGAQEADHAESVA